MAFNTKLPIVTDGLVFSIDPYNKKSYVSGNTTINDLVSNGMTGGTLENGVTFDDKNLVFDGTNQRITLPNLDFLSSVSQFSYDTWVKFDVDLEVNGFFACGVDAANDILMAFDPATPAWFCQIGNAGDGSAVTPIVPAGITTNWNNMAVVYDGTLIGNSNRVKIFINGVQQTLSFGAWTVPATTAASTVNASIADYQNFPGWELDGEMGPTKFWNRPLDSTEVLQNYRALKHRFV